jgi:4'-phosphopantetheinyl transferase
LYSYQLVEEKEFLEFFEEVQNHLPSSVLEKVNSFKYPADQQRSLMADLMVRLYYHQKLGLALNDIEYEYGVHEKPVLKGYGSEYFNISHSGRHVVVAISDQNVGIDVEAIKKDRRKIAQRFFTESEVEDMNSMGGDGEQIRYFYQLWTLKESYMKAIGDGMTMSLSSFAFNKKEAKFELLFSKYDMDWQFYSTIWGADAFLSICSKYPEPKQQVQMDLARIKELITSGY